MSKTIMLIHGAWLNAHSWEGNLALFAGSRRFGEVIPDSKYPGMWRSTYDGS